MGWEMEHALRVQIPRGALRRQEGHKELGGHTAGQLTPGDPRDIPDQSIFPSFQVALPRLFLIRYVHPYQNCMRYLEQAQPQLYYGLLTEFLLMFMNNLLLEY